MYELNSEGIMLSKNKKKKHKKKVEPLKYAKGYNKTSGIEMQKNSTEENKKQL